MARRRKLGNAVIYLILIVMSIIWLFPFVGLVLQSFRGEYGGMVDYLVPKQFSLVNYQFLFGDQSKFVRWYLNTLTIAIFVAILQTLVIICVSYALSRMRFKGRKALMNIPAELYESARIDGANPFQTFRKITLPYMLFVTGPFLLTQFIGNLNNFNVIFLLNQGNPKSLSLAKNAGSTDLLVTWLYKMTINDSNYKIAAVIGIMVFIVTAVISLIVYNAMPSVKDEEGFQ